MAATPEFPPPWTPDHRPDGWHVLAANRASFGPFNEPDAKLIAAVRPMRDALRANLDAATAAARQRARRLGVAALAQSEGRA